MMIHSKSRSVTLLAAVALTLAGAANAQTTTTTKERTTTTDVAPSGATTQTTTTTRTFTKTDSPDVVYRSLDTGNRGYVLQKDTERISGFGDAFSKADVNHKGQLTREEFNSAWTVYSK